MNFKNKKYYFGLIPIIISLVLGMNLPVSANSDNLQMTPESVTAEIYAKHYSVTMEEALHRLQLQDSFPGLSIALEKNEKLTYGGLWIQHEPDYKIIIAFTVNGEQTISEYSNYISKDVAPYIEIKTVKKSLEELLNEQDSLLTSLAKQNIKVDSRVDIINNCVSIDVKKTDKDYFSAVTNNSQLAIPTGLEINFVDGLYQLATNIYGGLTLNYSSGGSSCCTVGFSVTNSTGTVKGIITAGHATLNNLYYNSTALPCQWSITNGSYDVQFRTCPGLNVTNKIQWWSDGSTFDVNSKKPRSEQHVGDIVSKYGYNTFYTAGQITSTTHVSDPPYNAATWIEVANVFGYSRIADGGDSGGPWFTGNGSGVTALGITHMVSSDRQNVSYMAEDYLELMSMYVMTSP
jgi:hypothetical protein